MQAQLYKILHNKGELEERLRRLGRERADISGYLEDNEKELADYMKKYEAAVAQLSIDKTTITDLQEERNSLKNQLAGYVKKIQSLEEECVKLRQRAETHSKKNELSPKEDKIVVEVGAMMKSFLPSLWDNWIGYLKII